MTSTPTYTWNKVNGSTYYYLYVNGPSGNVISKWYTPAEANCDSASSTTCTITPTTTLANGSHTWWIQTWNPIGTGPWSSAMYFTVQSQGYAPKKVLAAPAVMDTVVATFVYDGDGKRVSQTIGGVITYFVGNYYEKTGSTITKYYYAGAQRVAMRNGSTVSYLLSDHLGSTSITTNSSGTLVSEVRYKACPLRSTSGVLREGETRYTSGTLPTKYTYTGQYSNVSDFGWMYYNARWYDPSLGRFAQADTVVPAPYNSQNWDHYAYVGNNPCRSIDPDGHCWPLCTMLVGAAIGAGVSMAVYAGVSALAGKEITAGGLAGAALSGGIAGAVAGVAGPVAGTLMSSSLMSAAGVVVTAESLAVGTAVVNGVIGTSAYVIGTTVQNSIDVPNGEQPVPITVTGALVAGTLNGVASYAVSVGSPPVNQFSILQAQNFSPGRTWNSVLSIAAQDAYKDVAAGAVLGTSTSEVIQKLAPPSGPRRCTMNGLVCLE